MKQQNLIVVAIALIATMSIFTACDGGSFTDPRDGQTYKTVKIGDQVWMTDKLKYKSDGGYTWESALAVCPEGWRLPTKSDFEPMEADTIIRSSWSTTEKENFTIEAYARSWDGNTILLNKHEIWSVRCIQGTSTPIEVKKINGYKAVRVGEQIWMADNLDIKTPNSVCYLDDENECSSGRFYPFSEAINVCPEGWHLPSKSEAAKFINKLIKENGHFEPTRGYYVSKDENFEAIWGTDVLWTSTYGYVMRDRGGDKGIWDGSVFIKTDNWKIAVRCIADAEVKE